MKQVQTKIISASIEVASAFINAIEQNCCDLLSDNGFVERLHALRDYVGDFYNVGDGNEITDFNLLIEYAPEKPMMPFSTDVPIPIRTYPTNT